MTLSMYLAALRRSSSSRANFTLTFHFWPATLRVHRLRLSHQNFWFLVFLFPLHIRTAGEFRRVLILTLALRTGVVFLVPSGLWTVLSDIQLVLPPGGPGQTSNLETRRIFLNPCMVMCSRAEVRGAFSQLKGPLF